MMNSRVPYQKKEIAPYSPAINYHLISEVFITLNCQLYFNLLHSITSQKLFEKHLCNQSSYYENIDDFHSEGKPSRATTKSTPFAVSKDKWDAKEDTGKSMKNAFHVLRYNKRHMSS